MLVAKWLYCSWVALIDLLVIYPYILPKKETEKTVFEAKFAKDDRICQGMLLHYMYNALLDIYMLFDHARNMWDALGKKYGSDDARTKRYYVSKWVRFPS